jgi:hypothetical protein
MLEYVENFNNLMYQMLAHNPTIDHEIFTTTFIDGLKDEIRSVVTIQMPKDPDTASSLALLHEEVLEMLKSKDDCKDQRKMDPSNWARSYTHGTISRPVQTTFRVESRTTQGLWQKTEATRVRNANYKISALLSYRRARGLCFTCAKKWRHSTSVGK